MPSHGRSRSSPRWFAVAALVAAGCGDRGSGTAPTASSVDATAAAAASAAPGATATASASASPAPTAGADATEGMAIIPEGIFLMGGDSEENTPKHEVVVARFELDLHEVTMEAYAACVAAGACKVPQKSNPFCNVLHEGTGRHPANCVDWNDATAFCSWSKKRLPTEREWEYAASGGPEQRRYSWGAEEPDRSRACYSHEGTCEVASFAAGAFGLYDMTGNVWEWTSSWYGPYPDVASSGRAKVNRGGSWSRRFEKWMRNSLRNRFLPEEVTSSLGFRCAKDVRPLACPKDAAPKGDGCERISGTPLCAPGESFVEGACRAGGIVPAWASGGGAPTGHLPSPTGSVAAAPSAPASAGPPTIGRGRSPGFDADCARIAPGMPTAYEFRGGGFHDREPLVRASGCKKRDVGPTWTSVCCPN